LQFNFRTLSWQAGFACKIGRRRKASFPAKPKGAPVGQRPSPVRPPIQPSPCAQGLGGIFRYFTVAAAVSRLQSLKYERTDVRCYKMIRMISLLTELCIFEMAFSTTMPALTGLGNSRQFVKFVSNPPRLCVFALRFPPCKDSFPAKPKGAWWEMACAGAQIVF